MPFSSQYNDSFDEAIAFTKQRKLIEPEMPGALDIPESRLPKDEFDEAIASLSESQEGLAPRRQPVPEIEHGFLGEVAAGLGRGALRVAATPAYLADVAGEAVGWEGLEKAGERGAEKVEKFIEESPGLRKSASISGDIRKNPQLWKDPNWYASIVSEGIPTVFSMLIPGLGAAKGAQALGWGAKGIRAARVAGGLGAAMGLEAGGAAEQARQYEKTTGEEIPIGKKLQAVIGTGVVAGALEYAPIFTIFGKAGGRTLVKRILTAMATEGSTEGAQEVVANHFAKAGYDVDKDMAEGIIESVVGGVLIGGGMGGIAGPVKTFQDQIETSTTPESIEKISEVIEEGEKEALLDRFHKGSVEDLTSLRKSPEGAEYAKELDQVIGEKQIAEERGLAPREEAGPRALPPGQGFGLLTEEEAQARKGIPYSPGLAEELQRPEALPPGQGFDLLPPKPETRLKKAPPTYPEGAEYVAGKPAPEGLKVEHKPALTVEEKPWKNKKNALRALESKRLASKNITSETHKVVPIEGGFQIVRKIKETAEDRREAARAFEKADKHIREKYTKEALPVPQPQAETKKVKPEKAKGKTLIAFVRAMGGIKDATLPGEVKALSGKETGVVGLTTKRTDKGLGFDEMASAAVEHGWLPENLENQSEAFSELLRNDIFAQKEGKQRAERQKDIAERTEREGRWEEFERSEDEELDYFAAHPEEEARADLDQWQRESIEEIRSRNDARAAREIEESAESEGKIEAKKETPGLVGSEKDEGWTEFSEAWDENDVLDEDTLAELEGWRVMQEGEGIAVMAKEGAKEPLTVKEAKLKEVSKKVKAETPTMLKESDKVNDVTLGTLVDAAIEDPAKALEHAAEATVSKAKLIEGLKNKGLKAMGEAKSKEKRAGIKKNLEETLRGIEEGKKEPVAEFKKLIPVQPGGRYFNLNEESGKVAFLIPFKDIMGGGDPRYQAKPVKGNIADLELNFEKLPESIQKAYQKWRNEFARKNLDKYNELINQEPMVGIEKKPKEPVAEVPEKEPVLREPEAPAETKSRLLENIKSEKGSSELINDLSRLGADAIKRGHTSFKAFSAEMKVTLGDAWAKVKHLMKEAYELAKKILSSERGAIEIGKVEKPKIVQEHPTLTSGAQKLLGELEDLKKEHRKPPPLPPEEVGTPAGKGTGAYNDLAARLRTRTVDRLYPLMYKLDEGLDITDPDAQAYIQGRMDTSAPTVVATFLQHGKLKWLENAPLVETKDKGFLPLTEKHGTNEKKVNSYDAEKQTLLKDKIGYKPKSIRDIDRYLFWKIATRAEKLMGEDREHLFTKKDIALLKEIGGKDWKDTDLNKEYVAFNKNVLDFAQEIGLIDPAMRKVWEHDEYIPFYRILEDELLGEEFLKAPIKSRKFIDSQIKKLVGGTDKLGDPFENILRNWSHLITESIRNRSRATSYKYMLKLGYAEPSKPPKYIGKPEKEAILSYMENGKRKYFKVKDLELFGALNGVNAQKFDGILMKMFGTSKRMLTYGATFGPAFRVANFMRDTLQTAMVNKSFIPVWDSLQGAYKAYAEHPDAIAMMSGGGGFSLGYVRGDDPKAMARHVRKIVRKAHKQGFTLSPMSLLEWWEKVGSASENAARVQLYANWRKKGASHLVAGYKARDVLDFSLSGDAQITQLMIRTMPFLGARMQGLYRMGRAYGENPGAFLLKGAILAGLSLAWWSGVKDDDRYKELEDWEKWTYRHFWIGDEHYRLPRAFEVDAIFSSSVESIADVLSENEEGKHIMHFIGQTMRDTFALDVPQLVRPLYEQAKNEIGFTGRPIISESMKRVKPGEQTQPWTSESLQVLGEKLNMSPMRTEALVRGYLATLGMFILGGTDVLVRWAFDFPAPPKKRVDDYPLIGRFARETPPRHTKYMTRFYKMTREMDVLVGTINHYKKTGDIEKAVELAKASRETLQYKKGVNRIRRRIGLVNGRIKMIHYQKDLTPEQKKEKIAKLLDYRNKILESTYKVMSSKKTTKEVSP